MPINETCPQRAAHMPELPSLVAGVLGLKRSLGRVELSDMFERLQDWVGCYPIITADKSVMRVPFNEDACAEACQRAAFFAFVFNREEDWRVPPTPLREEGPSRAVLPRGPPDAR